MFKDPWLIPDIAVIKQAVEDRTVTKVARVAGSEMLADCLTKSGAFGATLLDVIRKGEYILPDGW